MRSTKILIGDCLEQLRTLPDKSVHCCITSPPYWGLRSYLPADHPLKALEIGTEKTPQEYVEKIVSVFREVQRVLRDDGTLWLNLGDSYNGYMANQRGTGLETERQQSRQYIEPGFGLRDKILKNKDLVGIPWMVAFALRHDGWYLRSDIIWHKRNCMPESVTDRPTRSHEYLFLLSKSERYFYDHETIKEPCIYDIQKRIGQPNFENQTGGSKDSGEGNRSHRKILENLKRRSDKQRGHSRRHDGFNDRWDQMEKEEQCTGMRNKRDVWTISPANYPEAHFATFPPKLITPCVLAGTSEKGCCSTCGAPWKRIVEKGEPDLNHQRSCGGDKNGEYHGEAVKDYSAAGVQNASATKARILAGMRQCFTVGWKPSCECNAPVIPCTILDPFGGSGTTGEVARFHRRSAILIDLNPEYKSLLEKRALPAPGEFDL